MYVYVDRNNAISNESNESNNIRDTLVTWVPRTITVTGYFFFDDSLHPGLPTHPCTNVVLYDVDGTTKDSVANGAVWPDGHFVLGPIPNEDLNDDHGFLDLLVSVKARGNESCWNALWPDNWYVKIMNAQTDAVWSYESATFQDAHPSSDTLYVGVLSPTDYERRAAFHMLRVLTYGGWAGIRNRRPASIPIYPVRVYWAPGFFTGTRYKVSPAPPDSAIFVDGSTGAADSTGFHPDEYDESVLLHEYGHHIAYSVGFDTTSIGGHHDYSTPLNVAKAWSEGWADFFAGWRGGDQNQPDFGASYDYGRGPGGAPAVEEFHLESDSFYIRYPNLSTVNFDTCTVGYGHQYELEVAGSLWDIFDDHSDTPSGSVYPDSVSAGFDPIWSTLINTVYAPEHKAITSIDAFEAAYESQQTIRDVDYLKYVRSRWVFLQHGIGGPSGVPLGPPGPTRLNLIGAAPNPFNPDTRIRFTISGVSTPVPVTVRIFDVSGRLVRTVYKKNLVAGTYDVPWNAESGSRSPVASGVYFCEVECQGVVKRTKLVLIR